ncbi:helix-turn-helix domain-containing protein [Caldithrix abyssi]|uniref:Helix-turn-helix domain-containing protein n=1 Tax=Caldithrix abyssi DSM 13497 TaxID=880073 RepID=H1XW22_CALAY|nr:helix-turn-helix domain-containing protein [Caldithrix abyssi]APF17712.1 Helix-turn-helix domain-containing protein [Caldithrix abyssi DSM 13497]EHO41794.1 transcriptional regulator, AraC family [Caldithrix abyssi DSM 13497]
MYKILVDIDERFLLDECRAVFSEFGEVELLVQKPSSGNNNTVSFDALFFISNRLNSETLTRLEIYRKQYPKFPLVFYNHSLMLDDMARELPQKNLYLIVGDERKWHLRQLVKRMLKMHWRRLPYKELGIDFDNLSERMKKVLQYIETSEFEKCDIFHIADFLQITPSYFSQIFKAETGQSFRSFMQRVLNYYENLLFLDWGLEIKKVSRMLGYSELSSYSRSFKNRKGQSPRAFVKLQSRRN